MYYADMRYAYLSDVLRQANNNTENQLMVFSYSSWKYCPDTGISTGEYIILYQCGIMDHVTHVPGPVALQRVSKIQHELQEWLWRIL